MKKLLFILLILPVLLQAQHNLSGTFTPVEEYKVAILYKLSLANTEYINNASITNGHFQLNLDASLKPGMYRIVYALPQERYNFDFIYNNEDIVFKYNQDEGASFPVSKENQLLADYRNNMFKVKTKINDFYGKQDQNTSEYMTYISELNTIQSQSENASKGTLAHHFIKAEKPYSPTSFQDAETYFNNYKANYFKAINFTDPVLKNSSFLMDSALNYVFIFVDTINENKSYINNIDDVVKVTAPEKKLQKSILEVLWTQFKERQNDTVANYISATYLIPLLDPEKDKGLIEEMIAFQNTALGITAPDFSWPTAQGSKSLSSLSGKSTYIITFWSSTCSHCLQELPVLKNYLKNKKQIQVLAIGLEDQRQHWEQTIKDYPDFTQIYGDGKWDNPTCIAYGVTGTPSFFVLNENKEIIAKPDDVEALITFLNRLQF